MIFLTTKPTQKNFQNNWSFYTVSIKPRPYPPPLDYAIWGVLENKINATYHSNIGSLKTAIEEEWNKMFEEFILKTCKSFRMCVDTIIEKMAVILSKFTVLCPSFYFLNQN